MKLHIGCGPRRIPDYVNIDIREDIKPDVVDDIYTLEKFKSGSADVIYSSHVFEHVGRHDRLTVLKRWFDVLKNGGVIRVSVPDFEAVVKAYQAGFPMEKLISLLNGSQRHPYDIHYYCYDFNALKSDLESVGFVDVRRYDWRQTEHANIDDYSQAYLPHMDKSNGILMSLNVEATKREII